MINAGTCMWAVSQSFGTPPTEWACHLSTARQVCDCDVIAPCLLPYREMYRSRWLCVSLAESTRPISRPAAGNQQLHRSDSSWITMWLFLSRFTPLSLFLPCRWVMKCRGSAEWGKAQTERTAILYRDNGICHSVVIFAEISMKKNYICNMIHYWYILHLYFLLLLVCI